MSFSRLFVSMWIGVYVLCTWCYNPACVNLYCYGLLCMCCIVWVTIQSVVLTCCSVFPAAATGSSFRVVWISKKVEYWIFCKKCRLIWTTRDSFAYLLFCIIHSNFLLSSVSVLRILLVSKTRKLLFLKILLFPGDPDTFTGASCSLVLLGHFLWLLYLQLPKTLG